MTLSNPLVIAALALLVTALTPFAVKAIITGWRWLLDRFDASPFAQSHPGAKTLVDHASSLGCTFMTALAYDLSADLKDGKIDPGIGAKIAVQAAEEIEKTLTPAQRQQLAQEAGLAASELLGKWLVAHFKGILHQNAGGQVVRLSQGSTLVVPAGQLPPQ